MGGGSVRIHQADIQSKMFEVLGFTPERANDQFGFLLKAFKYGVPPHAGLAYGFDRMIMLMVGADSIRDVIAFPKVKDASCLMTKADGQLSFLYGLLDAAFPFAHMDAAQEPAVRHKILKFRKISRKLLWLQGLHINGAETGSIHDEGFRLHKKQL